MAKNTNHRLRIEAGVRSKYMLRADKTTLLRSAMTALIGDMTTASKTKTLWVTATGLNSEDDSAIVDHGPNGAASTPEDWYGQCPLSVQEKMEEGKYYGPVIGITFPFIASGPQMIFPVNSTAFDHCVDYLANHMAQPIINDEIDNQDEGQTRDNELDVLLASAISSVEAANNSFNGGNAE